VIGLVEGDGDEKVVVVVGSESSDSKEVATTGIELPLVLVDGGVSGDAVDLVERDENEDEDEEVVVGVVGRTVDVKL
jgi:hypothetical protein